MNLSELSEKQRRLNEIRLRKVRLQKDVLRAKQDVGFLLDHVGRMTDERTGEAFQFHLCDEDSPWNWQRLDVLNAIEANQKVIVLKARQLGITWVCAGYQLAVALTKPGTLHLIYRQKEEDSGKIVARIWEMFQSLPEHLRMGVTVLKPKGSVRPYLEIVLQHPDGRISTIRGMASTEAEGHGETAATVLIDEGARIEKVRHIWTAVNATVGTVGKIMVVSTANGVSNELTGEGNYFHRLWVTAEDKGLTRVFLPWSKHPDRDQAWYDYSSETRSLDVRERAEQYPSNPGEAFRLTTDVFFDVQSMEWYSAEAMKEPLYRMDFEVVEEAKARKNVHRDGKILVYEDPETDVKKYAIGADVASGQGRDYSAAYVVDLSNMALVAEFHAKLDPDLFAEQLHFLGKWYGTAEMAIDAKFGDPVIIPLRDGRSKRPAYPRLYRHLLSNRMDLPTAKVYGYPINTKTRPLILNQLAQAIRERQLPWMTHQLLGECQTFIRQAPSNMSQAGPWPRAQEGSNDDCVFAAAIALELFRLRGKAVFRRPRPAKPKKTMYPWQPALKE